MYSMPILGDYIKTINETELEVRHLQARYRVKHYTI